VTSSSEEKIAKAVEMGAKGGANYKDEKWAKAFGKEAGLFDVIIDSAGGPGFANLVRLAASGGRIGLYGGTRGFWEGVSPQLIFYRQIDILGSTMGSDKDFANMLDFVNEHKIIPVVDSVFSFDEAPQAFERMEQGKQFGKIVLKIN
jgi:NADPH:quinone reductase-like Zn-dependent oxidoreductase